MPGSKANTVSSKESESINQGLTRKEELNKVRGCTKIVDPELGPENK